MGVETDAFPHRHPYLIAGRDLPVERAVSEAEPHLPRGLTWEAWLAEERRDYRWREMDPAARAKRVLRRAREMRTCDPGEPPPPPPGEGLRRLAGDGEDHWCSPSATDARYRGGEKVSCLLCSPERIERNRWREAARRALVNRRPAARL